MFVIKFVNVQKLKVKGHKVWATSRPGLNPRLTIRFHAGFMDCNFSKNNALDFDCTNHAI